MSSRVGNIVTDAEKVFDTLKQTAKTAAGLSPKNEGFSSDDDSREKMEDFIDSHKYPGKSTAKINDEIPREGGTFGFTTAKREWPRKLTPEQVSSEARNFTAAATTSAVNAATLAATAATTAAAAAATTASVGFGAATREASKQFKVVTETFQVPKIPRVSQRKPKQKPVGNFKQTVRFRFSILAKEL